MVWKLKEKEEKTKGKMRKKKNNKWWLEEKSEKVKENKEIREKGQ